jgi:crotonobetainyl-CoA:carnitine CoA-transferase CaiB-like acyl-CoA transferase
MIFREMAASILACQTEAAPHMRFISPIAARCSQSHRRPPLRRLFTQHTDEILWNLGYDRSEIAALRKEKMI